MFFLSYLIVCTFCLAGNSILQMVEILKVYFISSCLEYNHLKPHQRVVLMPPSSLFCILVHGEDAWFGSGKISSLCTKVFNALWLRLFSNPEGAANALSQRHPSRHGRSVTYDQEMSQSRCRSHTLTWRQEAG